MSLEDAITANTAAVLLLVEAMNSSAAKAAPVEPKPAYSLEESKRYPDMTYLTARAEKVTESSVKPVSSEVEYQKVKDLIVKLAPIHREKIKEINKKYGLSVFADVLINPEDPSSGIANRDLFVAYHRDLISIEIAAEESDE